MLTDIDKKDQGNGFGLNNYENEFSIIRQPARIHLRSYGNIENKKQNKRVKKECPSAHNNVFVIFRHYDCNYRTVIHS